MKKVFILVLLVLLITGCTVDEPQAYDVVFDVDGGSSVLPQSVLENETIKKPSDPIKAEYVFMYWYTDNSSEPFDFTTQITSHITLHAKWREVIYYTVSFETNGGTTINDVTAKEETLVDQPNDPEKDSYVFMYWYTENSSEPFDFTTQITSHITLHAKWREVIYYTVSFETNGGTTINDVTTKEDALLDKPNDPSKDGYVFVRWYKDSELNTIFDFESDMVTQDITIYALWQEQTLYDLYQTLSQDVDYDAMGFHYSFDDPINNPSSNNGENALVDPFFGKTITYERPGRTGDYSLIAPFWSYFDEANYNIYTRWDVSRNAWYYADLKLVDDKWQVLFFPDGYEPEYTGNFRSRPFIDGIESNGYYSYVINQVYTDFKDYIPIVHAYYRIFYAIYHDNDFPYYVFYNDSYIFLINKSHHFDQSIVFDLVESNEFIFFK